MQILAPERPRRFYFDRVWHLSEIASEYINEVLDELGWTYKSSYKNLSGCCCVHGGDNRNALNVYTTGYSTQGNWICLTHHCEEYFSHSFFGLVRGILSHNKYRWSCPKDRKVSIKEAFLWLCSFLKIEPQTIPVKKFTKKIYNALSIAEEEHTNIISKWTRSQVRSRLLIPSPYFLQRKFSGEILEAYDIGECVRDDKPMRRRAIVPIYNEEGSNLVAYLGRSIDNTEPRWLNSRLYNPRNALFNYFSAKDWINETGTAILVEGPMDSIRLAEAGIHNSLAVFGTSLSDRQEILLEKLPIRNLVLALDNDKGGDIGCEELSKRFRRLYNVCRVRPINKDWAEMGLDSIRRIFDV